MEVKLLRIVFLRLSHTTLLLAQVPTNSGWWFGTSILFSHNIGNFIIPIDFHIFQKGGPNTNQTNDGQTAWDLASMNGHQEVVHELRGPEVPVTKMAPP